MDPGFDDDADEPRELNPAPFVVALVLVAVLAVLGYLFLRPDDSGELARPDRLEPVDDDTIRVVAFDRPVCEEVLRAQVDMAEEAVFVELVVDEREGSPCGDQTGAIEAEITLPAALDGRPLRAGVGRFQIPCVDDGATVTCTPDR
jgi:hypothetical protein